MSPIPHSMTSAAALVREGRLSEATAMIQRTLGGAAGEQAPPADGQEAPRPMRDVTPGPKVPPHAPPHAKAPHAKVARPQAANEATAPRADAGAAPRPRQNIRSGGLADGLAGGLRGGFPSGFAAPAEGWPRSGGPRIDLSALDSLRGGAGRASGLSVPEGARWEERRHAGPHGTLAYQVFLPSRREAGAPLLVMLHGCTQDPEDFARGTRMNAVAEEMGAVVIYPRQESSRNPNRCWSWFDPAQAGRSGEAAMIAAAARETAEAEGCDPARIFAAGLSAGGAMAAALGAAHPETIRAVGVHSGLPAGAARDMGSAFAAMGGRGGEASPLPVPAIVFHGVADRTVAPVNAERLARAGRDGATGAPKPRVRRGETGGRGFERVVLPAHGSAGAVELWRVEGLGHAWSGGSPDGSYADAAGPDASREMMRFFLEVVG